MGTWALYLAWRLQQLYICCAQGPVLCARVSVRMPCAQPRTVGVVVVLWYPYWKERERGTNVEFNDLLWLTLWLRSDTQAVGPPSNDIFRHTTQPPERHTHFSLERYASLERRGMQVLLC